METWSTTITRRNLELIFANRVRGTTTRGRDGVAASAFEAHLPLEISNLNRKLRGNRHTFTSYQQVLKSKGPGKSPRVISLPTVRDRIVLRAMAEFVGRLEPEARTELPQSLVARVIDAINTGDYNHYIKLDIVDFYPSLDHAWVRAALVQSVGRREIVDLFMSALITPTVARGASSTGVANERGIPQGLAISNSVAELSARHIDRVLVEDVGLKYFRFVDDILILSSRDVSASVFPRLQEKAALAGLRLHQLESSGGKSSHGTVAGGFDFLGYRFEPPRVSVRSESISRVESSIARIFTRYKYALAGAPRRANWPTACAIKLEWHLNLLVTGCIFDGHRLGWIAYFSQIRHQQLLMHFDDLVKRQMGRHHVVEFAPKSFVAAYRYAASRRVDDTGFVPNFDTYSVEDMRSLLQRVFFLDTREDVRSDDEIRELFRRRIRGVVEELERDIQASY